MDLNEDLPIEKYGRRIGDYVRENRLGLFCLIALTGTLVAVACGLKSCNEQERVPKKNIEYTVEENN